MLSASVIQLEYASKHWKSTFSYYLERVTEWEASGCKKEQHLVAHYQYLRKMLQVQTPFRHATPEDLKTRTGRNFMLLQLDQLQDSYL